MPPRSATPGNPADRPPQTPPGPRDRIVAAALGCFARLGFHGASMQDICAEAGMSAGNLYRYFKSKEAIIVAISEMERERNYRAFALLDEAEDPVEGLKSLARFFLAEMRRDEAAALCMEIIAEAIRRPEIRGVFDTNIAEGHEAVARALRRGMTAGHVAPDLDVDVTVRMLMALGDGLVAHAALADFMTPERMNAALSDMLERYLRPRGARPEPTP